MQEPSKTCADCSAPLLKNKNARGLCKPCYYRRKYRGQLLPPKSQLTVDEALALAKSSPDGCLLMPEERVASDGYAYVGSHGSAHRAAYERLHGAIPVGMDVGHTCHDDDRSCKGGYGCRHRRCVSPAHLEAQSRKDNLNSTPNSTRNRAAAQTHCRKRNHPLSGDNLYITTTGSRQCRACVRINYEARRDRRAVG